MKLSIITVSLNADKVIAKTIDSVLYQTIPVYEYIIMDGDSVDNTVNVAESYKEKFQKKGILYKIFSQKDQGISDAFNKGIEVCTGDVVGLINADDELIDNAVELLENYYNEKSDIYYGDCFWVDESKGRIEYKRPKHELNKLLYNMILYHPSIFVKKSVYEQCGGFDISYKYSMDKHFLYKCYLDGKIFEYINAPLTKFKAGGISDRNVGEVYKEGSRMALEFGEPFFKVFIVEQKKRIRRVLVKFIKKVMQGLLC